jgi:7-keto-8-aminopelargonate synthetase-like enzyme
VESLYSMDGTFAPLLEIIEMMEEIFPLGNAYLVVDEAHSTGIYGPEGRGRVALLGLEDKVLARLVTFGKALAATGGAFIHLYGCKSLIQHSCDIDKRNNNTRLPPQLRPSTHLHDHPQSL